MVRQNTTTMTRNKLSTHHVWKLVSACQLHYTVQ